MHGDQDGLEGRPAAVAGGADIVTAPLQPPVDEAPATDDVGAAIAPGPAVAPVPPSAAVPPVAPSAAVAPVVLERSEAEVRAFAADVTRLAGLVGELTTAASALGKRLDDEVRGVLDNAEKALADARGARQRAGEADDRTRDAEARAEAALQEAADAREELAKGLAAAKASVTAAQESEANAWKEAGAHQQARATSANEAAHADGLRKRAEAAWSTEHQGRVDAERERDELATKFAAEQSALATARAELTEARSELSDARAKLEAAAESERQLRAELSAARGEIAGLTVERDSVASRAAELATRADRAEQRADSAEARADRADLRADTAEIRIDRDAATVRALQDTLRAALDLPAVEDLEDGRGVQVGDVAVTAKLGGLIGVDQVPEVMDGELAGRFARAILAVRVHQATRRLGEEDEVEAEAEAEPASEE
ncbi:hypothetical protein [Actinomadura decatromicini]|uniref:Uncharacterized protein n=1 Tax=Actinomadura decatromicini TaxID=2604572 RepID=A0A5D3FS43_9ACTN|nr:hypothetical protein [Actinomadura decatromicini]TYK50939.1 hypothetical protein FXF68_10805 [Actinomadura decatromicini]